MKIVVKYYALKLLVSMDLNYLVQRLRETFGEKLVIVFEEMSEAEKETSVEYVMQIALVRKRVMVFADGRRRKDIEDLP